MKEKLWHKTKRVGPPSPRSRIEIEDVKFDTRITDLAVEQFIQLLL